MGRADAAYDATDANDATDATDALACADIKHKGWDSQKGRID